MIFFFLLKQIKFCNAKVPTDSRVFPVGWQNFKVWKYYFFLFHSAPTTSFLSLRPSVFNSQKTFLNVPLTKAQKELDTMTQDVKLPNMWNKDALFLTKRREISPNIGNVCDNWCCSFSQPFTWAEASLDDIFIVFRSHAAGKARLSYLTNCHLC